jgi:hypothetical protein
MTFIKHIREDIIEAFLSNISKLSII